MEVSVGGEGSLQTHLPGDLSSAEVTKDELRLRSLCSAVTVRWYLTGQ